MSSERSFFKALKAPLITWLVNQEKANFVRPGTLKIIVKKLTKEIVTEAIEAYAEDTGYWLKLYQFANSIDISIFNKLEAEHRKEWEGWEED